MRELDKLQKDDQYLEDVVRKKYGFLREGERLYRIEK
jgi:cell division protein FtsB